MPEILTAEGLTAGYGDSIVLEDVSIQLAEGGSLALLGRNGVGKTTLLLTLMGLTRLQRGSIVWQGADITRLPTFRRAHAGLGWVPQERFMFPSLTVEEHLTVVARPGAWASSVCITRSPMRSRAFASLRGRGSGSRGANGT